MMFRKACQFKKSSWSQFRFGNIVNLVHFHNFLETNDVISRSYKIVDNWKMKQGITKL